MCVHLISVGFAIAGFIALSPQSNGAGCQLNDGQVPWSEIDILNDKGACSIKWPDETAADSLSEAFRIAEGINSEMVARQLSGERDWSRFRSENLLEDYWASIGRNPSGASMHQDLIDLADAITAVAHTWFSPNAYQVERAQSLHLDFFAIWNFLRSASEFLSEVIDHAQSSRAKRIESAFRAGIADLVAGRTQIQSEIGLLQKSLSDDLTLDEFLVLSTALGDLDRRLAIINGRHDALIAALPSDEPESTFETRQLAMPDPG